ncbi:SpoIIE family protein phosphatase [Actinoplanes sp. CA-252034]|uniref:SpoIIE family protein phosphatase n=1 Tax=Actinoplanes sp. CA-252034 TaxID=3239906 RepID=UPI003D99D246
MTGWDTPDAGDRAAMIAAVDQLPFIVIVSEGPDLVVVGGNAATRAVLPGRELVGRTIRDVLSDLSGQQFVDAFHEVYRTGETISGRQWRVHLDQPDGSVGEMFATFALVPWRHADGSMRGVIGAAFDVTELARERQAAEAEAERQRRRYEQTRDVIDALQRELLPAGLPVLPGLQVAAAYLLADADTRAGGDWYDAVTTPDGRIALVAGDVVGHGVTASGVMGQLRAVLQERLDAGASITEALVAADRLAGRVRAAHAATVSLVVLDPGSGELSYCTAGHPSPLVIPVDGPARYLDGTRGAPLGTGGAFPIRHDRLGPGETLLLYTDGILERPGAATDPDAELAHVAGDAAAGRALHDPSATVAERVCTQTLELLVRSGGHADDITLLAAQRVAVVPQLALDLAAKPEVLGRSRRDIGAWLAAVGAAGEDVFVLQHALGELVTNAIEHGGGDDVVEIRARLLASGLVEATVTDHGGWRAPERRPTRGRGLALTAQLVQSLRVEPGGTGTIATVRHPLLRPARLLSSSLSSPVPASRGAELTITELPGGDEARVRIDGPLDAASAFEVRTELLRRSRGGTVPMTVDLSGVSLLASAGVSALHEISAQHLAEKAPLTIVTSPGSPAQRILDLVGLASSTGL